jgi:hypothetical protein
MNARGKEDGALPVVQWRHFNKGRRRIPGLQLPNPIDATNPEVIVPNRNMNRDVPFLQYLGGDGWEP